MGARLFGEEERQQHHRGVGVEDLVGEEQALGLDPARAHLYAPEVSDYQPAALFSPGDAIPIQPRRGWMLIVDEEAHEAQHPARCHLDPVGFSSQLAGQAHIGLAAHGFLAGECVPHLAIGGRRIAQERQGPSGIGGVGEGVRGLGVADPLRGLPALQPFGYRGMREAERGTRTVEVCGTHDHALQPAALGPRTADIADRDPHGVRHVRGHRRHAQPEQHRERHQCAPTAECVDPASRHCSGGRRDVAEGIHRPSLAGQPFLGNSAQVFTLSSLGSLGRPSARSPRMLRCT